MLGDVGTLHGGDGGGGGGGGGGAGGAGGQEGCEVQLGSSHGSLQSAAATRQQGDVDPEIVHSDAASKAAPACRRCEDVDDGDLDGEQMHMWGLDEKPGKVEVDEWQGLVSLWDRLDGNVVMHEAPSCLEVSSPDCEGWVTLKTKGRLVKRYAILKRAHLLFYESPEGHRPLAAHSVRRARLSSKGTNGRPLPAPAPGCFPFSIKLSKGRLVLAAPTQTQAESWRYSIVAAICRAASDPRAILPLPCTPSIVKERAMRGVPDCFRGIVWQKLSGADQVVPFHRGVYDQLLESESSADERILRDLSRTMPGHPFFKGRGERGQKLIFNVAHAYAVHDSQVGYSQGINFLAAILLLHMRQEHAFWTLHQLMRRYRMRGLFLIDSPALAAELKRIQLVLYQLDPKLAAHLQDINLDVTVHTTQWIITLFSYSFPLGFCFRVMDAVLVKGLPFATQVSVALIRHYSSSLLEADMEGAIYLFKDIPPKIAADPKLADSILIAAHSVKWDAAVQDGVDRYVREECMGEGGKDGEREGGLDGRGGGEGDGERAESRGVGEGGGRGVVGGWEGEEGDEADASSEGSGNQRGGCSLS